MLVKYVWRDLLRNPRRTLTSLVGVVLGVGLFSAVLFFIDGSGASMTSRAIAPLALDMQRVLTSPLGDDLRFTERLAHAGPLHLGQTTRVILTVINDSAVPAHEVVVRDVPPPPLACVRGTATLGGRLLLDPADGSPLAQGAVQTGLNIGTIAPGATVRLTYVARVAGPIASPRSLALQGTISTREQVVPRPANTPPRATLEQLAARVSRLPGVVAADPLAFVDLPAGALRGGGAANVGGSVRLFAFDRRYQQHYPSIHLVAGTFRTGAALLSAEAARATGSRPGDTVRLRLPGVSAPLVLRVSGIADLSRANPLFYSRQSSNLEDFIYVPNAVVVDPAVFRRVVIPAYRAARARQAVIKSLPLLELDILVRRSRLHTDPATALAQTQAIAQTVNRIAPIQDYLIDNISNTLQVARDDAVVAKRMFVFLGLPGALLAAFLATYAGGILASAQRREQANLRIRGAHRAHLLRMLLYRTLALAGAGSALGCALGLVSVLVVLEQGTLFAAAPAELGVSALVAGGVGVVVTALALYVPAQRSLRREIGGERGEMVVSPLPAWRRLWLDVVLVAATGVAEIAAFRAGAFDAPAGSVYNGQAVSLSSHLLLAPLAAWVGGLLLAVRLFQMLASRVPIAAPPAFGPLLRGILARTLRRRSWALAGGVVALGMVVAFGTSLALFAATYDAAKAADARFFVGSDIRVTPSVLSTRSHPPDLAARFTVPGVTAATPVVYTLGNSILISAFTEDRTTLAAIDPATFRRVAALSDAFFPGATVTGALTALAADPRGVLLESGTADHFKVQQGDRVQVVFARGTTRQTTVTLRVLGLFDRLPGFAQGANLVVNLGFYERATGVNTTDFFLLRSDDPGHGGLSRALASLRSGLARTDQLHINTTETTIAKDQSSLTALNIHDLLSLDSFFTLLMAAARVGIFVFGLLLQRRREYVTLSAQGMATREIRILVVGESVVVVACGVVAGVVVGVGMAALLVHVLRPLFVLHPIFTPAVRNIALLAGLALVATVAGALAATALLRRLRPTELLREE